MYAAAVKNKRRYWPKNVPGNEIDDKIKNCKIGKNKVITSKLEGKQCRLFMMKEPAFVRKMITTYGDLSTASGQEKLGVILRTIMVSNKL